MTFYLVVRDNVEEHISPSDERWEWVPLEVTKLSDGEHLITHNDVSVPVEIRGNQATVDLSRATGDLTTLSVHGMGDDWSAYNREEINKVTLGMRKDGDGVLMIHRKNRGISSPALIEWHDEAPKVFDFGRRK